MRQGRVGCACCSSPWARADGGGSKALPPQPCDAGIGRVRRCFQDANLTRAPYLSDSWWWRHSSVCRCHMGWTESPDQRTANSHGIAGHRVLSGCGCRCSCDLWFENHTLHEFLLEDRLLASPACSVLQSFDSFVGQTVSYQISQGFGHLSSKFTLVIENVGIHKKKKVHWNNPIKWKPRSSINNSVIKWGVGTSKDWNTT